MALLSLAFASSKFLKIALLRVKLDLQNINLVH